MGSPNGSYDGVCDVCGARAHVARDGEVYLVDPHVGTHSWEIVQQMGEE